MLRRLVMSAIAAGVALAMFAYGCVDEHRVRLPAFAPDAALLLVLQGLNAPAAVYAFQADANGLAQPPAFTASASTAVTLIELGCTLESLEIDAGWQRREGRNLPESPLGAYRLTGPNGGDHFEPFTYEAAKFSEVKVSGPARDECVSLRPTLTATIPFARVDRIPFAIPLPGQKIMFQAWGLAEDMMNATFGAFILARNGELQSVPDMPIFTRAGILDDRGITLLDAGGQLYAGPIEGPYVRTATVGNGFLYDASLARAPGDDTLWVATSNLDLTRIDGDKKTVIFDGEQCSDECERGGLYVRSSTEAYAIFGGRFEIARILDETEVHDELLDSLRYHLGVRMAAAQNGEPLIISQLGAIFQRHLDRWEVISPLKVRDADAMVSIPGGILIIRNGALLVEAQLIKPETICAPIDLVADRLLNMFLQDGELVLLYRGPNEELVVSFNALERKLNRCTL